VNAAAYREERAVRDALKNYLTLASGLTEVGRQRAVSASRALVAQGEATAEQVSSLAEDLIQTSKNNREMITALVRNEVEKALNVVGLATADSVDRLTKRLQSLESALRDASTDKPAAKKAASKPAAKAAAKPAKRAAKPAAKAAKAAKPAKPAATRPATKPAAKKATTRSAAKKPAKAAAKAATKAAKKPAKKAGS
jgi:polyhydroxyalkanoate synthesis regulator phasin